MKRPERKRLVQVAGENLKSLIELSSAPNFSLDFSRVRESADAVLGKHHLTIHHNVKDAVFSFDQARCEPKFVLKLRRQTCGARVVVSNNAVFDRDIHVQASTGAMSF
jgi:hypothetical protein